MYWLVLCNLTCLCWCIYVIATSRTFHGSNYICMLLCKIRALFCWLILFVAVTVFTCVTQGCLLMVFPGPAGWFATRLPEVLVTDNGTPLPALSLSIFANAMSFVVSHLLLTTLPQMVQPNKHSRLSRREWKNWQMVNWRLSWRIQSHHCSWDCILPTKREINTKTHQLSQWWLVLLARLLPPLHYKLTSLSVSEEGSGE